MSELGTLADSLPVSALDRAGVRALLERVCGASLDDEVVETAYRRTAGNPFFVGEVGRLMGSAYQGCGSGATAIPEGVRSVVERRLARLPQACFDLLTIAAVVGQEADVSLLASVSDLPEPVVFDLLGAADQARVTQPSAAALPRVRFTHDLFRETLYEGLAGHQRVEVHRRIGLALEQRRAEGSAVSPAELAHHVLRGCRGADDQRRAARCSLDAALDALGRLALREGLAHAERALT
ncbi:MAG: ATPase, partial [Actinobacteria bacterium]|nr:ATPase [Actinomycetota bacterium]